MPHQLPDRTQVAPLAHCCFHLSAYGVLATVSRSCPPPQGTSLCFTHPSAAISSKIHRSLIRKKPPNLHVLSTPPAFILSQDQTLRKIFSSVFNRLALLAWLLFIFFLCQGAAPDDSMFNVNVRLAQCKRNDTPGSNFCLHLLLDFIRQRQCMVILEWWMAKMS